MPNSQSCADIDRATEDSEDRVGIFADSKPNCACEHDSLSEHSPGLVRNEETILRVVCVPMHIHPKRRELKSSFFSHAMSRGLSGQRSEASSTDDLKSCVEALVSGAPDRVWLGYVEALASAIRETRLENEAAQSFCVADAALESNRAHAEIHCARRIPEADQIEYRVALMDAFNARGVRSRRELRDGEVWNTLSEEIKGRPVPVQWADFS
jgi:hypothetical protein